MATLWKVSGKWVCRRVPWAGGALQFADLQFAESELILNYLPQTAAGCKPFGGPADPTLLLAYDVLGRRA